MRDAHSTLERAIDVILSSVKWQFALFYLDNIATFSKSSEQHIDNVLKVLILLKKADVTCKLKKCRVFTETID